MVVPADGGEKKKIEENSKKGDSKGGGRAEAGAGGKEGTTSGANVGTKNKQDGGDGGSKRLVSPRAKKYGSQYCAVRQTGNVSLTHDSASDVLLLHNRIIGTISLTLSLCTVGTKYGFPR